MRYHSYIFAPVVFQRGERWGQLGRGAAESARLPSEEDLECFTPYFSGASPVAREMIEAKLRLFRNERPDDPGSKAPVTDAKIKIALEAVNSAAKKLLSAMNKLDGLERNLQEHLRPQFIMPEWDGSSSGPSKIPEQEGDYLDYFWAVAAIEELATNRVKQLESEKLKHLKSKESGFTIQDHYKHFLGIHALDIWLTAYPDVQFFSDGPVSFKTFLTEFYHLFSGVESVGEGEEMAKTLRWLSHLRRQRLDGGFVILNSIVPDI